MAKPPSGWAITPETQPDSGQEPSQGQHPFGSEQRNWNTEAVSIRFRAEERCPSGHGCDYEH